MNFRKCIHVDSSYSEPSADVISQASFFLVALALASCTSCCRDGSEYHKLLCIWLQLCDIMLARHSTVAHATFHCSVVLHAAVSQSNMLFLVNTCTRFSWINRYRSWFARSLWSCVEALVATAKCISRLIRLLPMPVRPNITDLLSKILQITLEALGGYSVNLINAARHQWMPMVYVCNLSPK